MTLVLSWCSFERLISPKMQPHPFSHLRNVDGGGNQLKLDNLTWRTHFPLNCRESWKFRSVWTEHSHPCIAQQQDEHCGEYKNDSDLSIATCSLIISAAIVMEEDECISSTRVTPLWGKRGVSQSSSPRNGVIQQFDNEYREWRRNQLMQLGARYPGLSSGYCQFHILSYRCTVQFITSWKPLWKFSN